MKAYKNYMDRIRLDEEQHGRLMEAVKAAEAAEAAKKAETQAEAPAKVRRFPLRGLAWIASAAAVIVLIVAVVPKNRLSEATANNCVTEAYAGEDTAVQISKQADSNSLETIAPAAEQNAVTTDTNLPETRYQASVTEEQSDFSVIYGTAEYSLRKFYAGTSVPEQEPAYAATMNIDDDSYVYSAKTESALLHLQTMVGEMTYMMTAAPEDTVSDIPEEAEPVGILEPEESAEPDGSELSEACTEDENCTEDAESTEGAMMPDEAIAFEIGEDRFDYDSEEGLLSADGREYRLTEKEKKDLNSLLDSIFTDR